MISCKFLLWLRTVVQSVTRLRRKTEASVRSQFSPLCDLWWMKWQWDRFVSEYFVCRLSVSFHQCSVLIFSCMLLLTEGQTAEAWEPSRKLPPVHTLTAGSTRYLSTEDESKATISLNRISVSNCVTDYSPWRWPSRLETCRSFFTNKDCMYFGALVG
jgi:hypothetical protein